MKGTQFLISTKGQLWKLIDDRWTRMDQAPLFNTNGLMRFCHNGINMITVDGDIYDLSTEKIVPMDNHNYLGALRFVNGSYLLLNDQGELFRSSDPQNIYEAGVSHLEVTGSGSVFACINNHWKKIRFHYGCCSSDFASEVTGKLISFGDSILRTVDGSWRFTYCGGLMGGTYLNATKIEEPPQTIDLIGIITGEDELKKETLYALTDQGQILESDEPYESWKQMNIENLESLHYQDKWVKLYSINKVPYVCNCSGELFLISNNKLTRCNDYPSEIFVEIIPQSHIRSAKSKIRRD